MFEDSPTIIHPEMVEQICMVEWLGPREGSETRRALAGMAERLGVEASKVECVNLMVCAIRFAGLDSQITVPEGNTLQIGVQHGVSEVFIERDVRADRSPTTRQRPVPYP